MSGELGSVGGKALASQIDSLAHARAVAAYETALPQNAPSFDFAAAELLARVGIKQELAALNEPPTSLIAPHLSTFEQN